MCYFPLAIKSLLPHRRRCNQDPTNCRYIRQGEYRSFNRFGYYWYPSFADQEIKQSSMSNNTIPFIHQLSIRQWANKLITTYLTSLVIASSNIRPLPKIRRKSLIKDLPKDNMEGGGGGGRADCIKNSSAHRLPTSPNMPSATGGRESIGSGRLSDWITDLTKCKDTPYVIFLFGRLCFFANVCLLCAK